MSKEEPLRKTIESQVNKNEETEEKEEIEEKVNLLSNINKTLLLFISSLNLLIMEVKSEP